MVVLMMEIMVIVVMVMRMVVITVIASIYNPGTMFLF